MGTVYLDGWENRSNVFVLISGYFLIIAPKIKISKVIKLWLQIAFYSLILFALFVGAYVSYID